MRDKMLKYKHLMKSEQRRIRIQESKLMDKQMKNKSFNNEALTWYFKELEEILIKDRLGTRKIVAIGECGLDFERFNVMQKNM